MEIGKFTLAAIVATSLMIVVTALVAQTTPPLVIFYNDSLKRIVTEITTTWGVHVRGVILPPKSSVGPFPVSDLYTECTTGINNPPSAVRCTDTFSTANVQICMKTNPTCIATLIFHVSSGGVLTADTLTTYNTWRVLGFNRGQIIKYLTLVLPRR